MGGRKKKPEPLKVFHICRYEQWFEMPAGSGYCNEGPLKFFRFFVSGTDPSAKEFLERVDRLSCYGDEHHLLGIYTRLVAWASLQPRERRAYLWDVDDHEQPMSFEWLAWKLRMDVEAVVKDLAALTKCRLIEQVELQATKGQGNKPDTAAGTGGRTGRRKADKTATPKKARTACNGPPDPAERSGRPQDPAELQGTLNPKLEPEPERVTGEPDGENTRVPREREQDRYRGREGAQGAPRRGEPEPDAEGQGEPEVQGERQPEATGQPDAEGGHGTQIQDSSGPPVNDNPTRFYPPRAAARGHAPPAGQPPGPADTLTRPGRFAISMFQLVECPYSPKSQDGLSELECFAKAWRKAESSLPEELLSDLWESMEREARKIAKQRRNPRIRWRKSPEAKLRWLFDRKLEKRVMGKVG